MDRAAPPTAADRDRGWMAQIAAGGPPALAALGGLFEVYNRPFLRFAGRHGLAPAEAEDVVHAFWHELLEIAHSYPDTRCDPLPWLYRTLFNRIRRAWDDRTPGRSHRQRAPDAGLSQPFNDLLPLVDAAAELDDSPPSPMTLAQQRQYHDCLRTQYAAFRQASPDDARLLNLSHACAFTSSELALYRYEHCRHSRRCKRSACEQWQCDEGTLSGAEKALSRARARIRALLAHCASA